MTVTKLIEQLSELDGNLTVVVPSGDEGGAHFVSTVDTGKFDSNVGEFEPYENEYISMFMKINAVRIQ